jgi:hypothetical protein
MNRLLFNAVTLALVVSSCSQPPECKNKNAVFQNASYRSPVYQKELAQLLRGQENKFLYSVDGYYEQGSLHCIVMLIQGNDLCARAWLEVPEYGPLYPVRKTKAMGYHGARLSGLKFDIVDAENGVRLIYKGIDDIID